MSDGQQAIRVDAVHSSSEDGPAVASAGYERLRRRYDDLVDVVIPIGAALFAERDLDRLLERILIETQRLCNADGGTLYLLEDGERLRFNMVRNRSLGYAFGGPAHDPPPFAPLPLRDAATGEENHTNAATHVALTGRMLAIPDVYREPKFDFAGARSFDKSHGYTTRSLLTVALRDSRDAVRGVLQLVNATCDETGAIAPFDSQLRRAVAALALLAGTALEAHLKDQELRNRIRSLEIRIDSTQRKTEVAQITSTDYFQSLTTKARTLRDRYRDRAGGSDNRSA